MSNPVKLQVIPVHELREPSQAFRCDRMSATLTARTCAARQQQAQAKSYDCPMCRDCAIGKRVARNVRLKREGDDLIPGIKKSMDRSRRAGLNAHKSQPSKAFYEEPDEESAA